MADYVKRKIVEKLTRFTKNLKPSDISLSFLSGKGVLQNLELNAMFITEVLQLPPWIQIEKVWCDSIRGHVPFLHLKSQPVTFYAGKVTIDVSSCTDKGSRESHSELLKKIGGGKPSKYGLAEKVIDGMRVEIRSIVIRFQDPTFHAQLEMNGILIESTTPDWNSAKSLGESRYTIADEDTVVLFKKASWGTLKLEGWSTSNSSQVENHNSRIRLISDKSTIKIAFKRNLSNSDIIATRVSVTLGDIIWIVTQSQLRAVSKLVQSLMQAAVKTAQAARLEREGQDSDRESVDSIESTTSTTSYSSELSGGRPGEKRAEAPGEHRKTSRLSRKSLSVKERIIKQRTTDYHEGKQSVPKYEVVQDSFHLRSGKIDLQLCDDTEESHTAQGSMSLELSQLVVDVYFDQQAGVGRAHWNEANDYTAKNAKWSRKLIQRASKTQFMDFPSIDLVKLRERGVVIKCSDFSLTALKSSRSSKEVLPIIACDKKTFCIPDDIYNPAFQVGLTFYHYPPEHTENFSAPRPNVFVYVSPLHINVDQRSCLWLVEFVYGVVKTINMEIAVSVHDEGKSYIESKKADTPEIHQLPGVDAKIKVLFTKVTIPLPGEVVVEDGRPKALQVETGAIKVKNRTLESLLSNLPFKETIQSMKSGWVFETQDSNQFPHFAEDVQSLPSRLRELLDQATHRERSRSVSSTSEMQRLNSDDDRKRKLDLATMEGWHIHTDCVHVSFAESFSHEATLYTTTFVDDFPVHLWLFPPRPDMDSTLPTSPPTTPSHSPQPPNSDPVFSFLARAPNLIRAELNRAQLLFLMRLKDSITMFKNKLMEFLDTSTFVPPKRSPSPSAESQTSSIPTEDSTDDTKTMSGCVIVEHVEANILLPSIFTDQPQLQSPTTPRGPQEGFMGNPQNDSNATVTEVEATKDAVSPPQHTDHQDSADLVVSQPQHSTTPAESIDSLAVNLPVSPVDMSSLDSADIETQSVVSLPATPNPGNRDTRLYSSASNLRTTRLRADNKSPSSSSLSTLPSRSVTAPPPPSLDNSPNTHLPVTSVSASTEPLSRASTCSLDDFVVIPNFPTLASNENSAPDDPEVRVVVSPPLEKPDAKSRHRLKSPPPLSERKVRSVSPPKSEPEYILCIRVDGIHALPNILTSGSISARCNANSIDIREIKEDRYKQHKEESASKRTTSEYENCPHPVIKARIEIGDQVARFFPKTVTDTDAILVLKATDLDVGLLTQNLAVLADFFNDEFESEQPIPIHVRVDNTKLVILDKPGDSIDNWKSVCVEVNQADIHRGRSLADGVNIFMDGGHTGEPPSGRMSRNSEQEAGYSHPEPTQVQSLELQNSNTELLSSFESFISSFEVHMKLHGFQAPLQPDHIAGVLAELQTSMGPQKAEEVDHPPPPYSEAMSVMVTSHFQSASDSNSEVIRLRRENEQLRQLQLDRDKLNSQLVEAQSKLEQSMLDFDMVTEECKKAKEELVVYKQVLEKQQETMETLLSENFDLRKRAGFV